MSDRIADQVGYIIERIDDIEPETDDQVAELTDARESLARVAEIDRGRHGPTPDEKLVAAVKQTDVCLGCGDPIDEGGFCGIECLAEVSEE
jgi:hypothetical protein